MKRYIAAVFLGLCTLAIAQEEKNIRPNSAALQLTKEQHQAIQAAIQKLKTEKEREAAKVLTPIEQIAQFICLPAAKEEMKKQISNATHISIHPSFQEKLTKQEATQALNGVIEIQGNGRYRYYLFECKLNANAAIIKFTYEPIGVKGAVKLDAMPMPVPRPPYK